MNTSFDYYRIFYYIAKYQNITKAAAYLMTSQPAVTRSLHYLERDLGCRLFVRSQHGVTLTPEGQTLYAHIAPACELIMQGEDTLASTIGLENGVIYIGTSETALHEILLDVLDEFHRLYPNIRLKIMNNTIREAVACLKSGQVDLAVIPTMNLELDKPLSATRLKAFKDIMVAGSQFSDLKDKVWSLKDLEKYPLICLPKGSMTYDFLDQFYMSHNLKLTPDIEAATVDLIIPMVRHNLGLAFISKRLAEYALQTNEIFQVELTEQPPERYVYLVENKDQPLGSAAKMLKLLLLNHNAENPAPAPDLL